MVSGGRERGHWERMDELTKNQISAYCMTFSNDA